MRPVKEHHDGGDEDDSGYRPNAIPVADWALHAPPKWMIQYLEIQARLTFGKDKNHKPCLWCSL